ncbi:putative ankyrin repeat protein RF_0381 [Haliotis rubra]|uniref:putative ankyrin repeat protein RF_0381 n=1 Tax=Haliotis rubra TaxID=36100 RepID=UPI001EE522E5|nr:putative ankyrin repeat protein RF_0381 [Haliotis rubra]
MSLAYARKLDPFRKLRKPLAMARLSFQISLESDDNKREVVGNLGRTIVKKTTFKISENAILSFSYTDLWRTLSKRENMKLEYELAFNDYSNMIMMESGEEGRYTIDNISLEFDKIELDDMLIQMISEEEKESENEDFWHSPLAYHAKKMSAFATPDRLYQYKVMPFGLKNAPVTFPRLVNNVTSGLDSVKAYMDDVINGWEDHLKGTRAFFKSGRDQAQTQNTGSSTLIDACRNGDLPQVKHILSQGTANINTREYDRTPAMIAVNEGHREILELLVKKGSDLSQLDDDQNNILHLASKEGHLEIVKYIHSLNIIDIESRGVHGKTPIMLAALFGQTGVFVFLVEMGAHLSLLDDSAENILHLSCRGGDEKIVKYIIKLNVVDINSKQLGGKTAVSLAAASGNRAAFDNLVEMRADLLAVDVLGNSVLHLACQGGNMDIVKYAVKQNIVDINSRRADGRTPASIAAVSGHSALFQYLVKVGADMSVVDVYGDNILHSSSAGGNMDIVKYVCKQNIVDINTKAAFGETPASIAATYGHLAVLEYLVKSGANLSAVNEDGDNILHLACQGGDLDTVKYVLNLNVVDINSKGIDGYTPLMLARELEDRDVFDLLIESGADVPVENYDRDNVFRMDMITFCKMCCHTAWQF